MVMMAFQKIAMGPKIESMVPLATDFIEYQQGPPTVKFAKELEKHQHDLGEYSNQKIMRTKIHDYEKTHQKCYDMYQGFMSAIKPDDDDNEQKTIRVSHYFFDIWTIELNLKLQAIKKGDDPQEASLSDYEFSNINLTLLDKYPKNLEHFLFLRNLVEYQFDRTKKFYSYLLMVFGLNALLFFL